MPGFTCGHSEKSNQRRCERLEVCMNSESILKLNFTENLHTQDWVNKNDKEKQCSNICQLWESINKGIEQDSQVLVFTDNFENSADSEWSDNGCGCSDVQANIVEDHTDPGYNNDGQIEFVPAVIEVVLSEGNQLNNSLNSVDDVECQVDWGNDSCNLWWFIVPGKS